MKLVTVHGKDPLQANQLVDQMYVYLENEREKEKANAEDDDEYENTDVAPVAETAMAPVEEIEEGFYGDDQNTDMANEIAMEDSEVDDDDSEIESDIVMRHGGLHKSQDGDIVNSELWNTENNQVEFPGIESYMPQSYVDMYGNTNESIAARAWQEPTETEEVVEDTSYTEPVVDPSTLKKGGTYKTNKRNFVKSILGLVKKQMGGEEETSSNSADPTGQDVRTNNLNSFLGVLKNQSKLAIAEEEAKKVRLQMQDMNQMRESVGGATKAWEFIKSAISGAGSAMSVVELNTALTTKALDGNASAINEVDGNLKRLNTQYGAVIGDQVKFNDTTTLSTSSLKKQSTETKTATDDMKAYIRAANAIAAPSREMRRKAVGIEHEVKTLIPPKKLSTKVPGFATQYEAEQAEKRKTDLDVYNQGAGAIQDILERKSEIVVNTFKPNAPYTTPSA